jgi:diguanylate cyclase (GGDEF)-like protein
LEYLSSYDTLTNIPNRRTFEEKFNSHLLLKKRRDSDLGVIFFDVDDFKSINDKLGHQKGDMVLRRIASILKKSVRKTDLIARWGGEEFIVALIDSSLDDTLVVCEKIRSSLEEDLKLKNICNYCVTASFGLTMVSQEDTIEKVVQRADEAMYEAKKEGKNRTKILN